jgi:hypothetical protein
MKRKIGINENSQLAYIPDDLIKEGYKGDVDVLANFNTVTLLRPGSNIDDQILSLELVIQDLKMRKKAEGEQSVKSSS